MMSASFSSSGHRGKEVRKATRTARCALRDFSLRTAIPESVTHEPRRLSAGTSVTPAPAPTSSRIVIRLVCWVLILGPVRNASAQNETTCSLRQCPSSRRRSSSAAISLQRHLIIDGQRMIAGQGDPERLVEQHDFREAAVGGIRCDDRRVDSSVEQLAFKNLRQVLRQAEFDLWQPVAQGRQQGWRQVGTDCRNHAETQWSRQGVEARLGGFLDQVRRRQQGPCLGNDFLVYRRDPDAAFGALEQCHAKLVFQLADLRAECRLTDETGFRRAAKTQVVCHGDGVSASRPAAVGCPRCMVFCHHRAFVAPESQPQ